jgi:predicted HTH transcriptional regulator
MITKLSSLELRQIIETKKETVNYDFKAEFQKNKAALVLDILCMLNSRDKRVKYIIYGVGDDGKIIGITEKPNFSVTDITDILMNADINSMPHIEYYEYNLDNKKNSLLTNG